MPFIKIYVHAVWSTKDRYPYLIRHSKAGLIAHVKEYAQSKNIHLDHINGGPEHLHALISMSADQNIATIMNLIKGESSHWINKQGFFRTNSHGRTSILQYRWENHKLLP
jgi:REP element-mobilizing transposase RayT